MTVRDALARACAILDDSPLIASSGTSGLDASLLLADCLGLSRSRILAAASESLDADTLTRFFEFIALRATGKPVAYILGAKEFYGHGFIVDENVLIPRPDSETLVDAALGSASWPDAITGSESGRESGRESGSGKHLRVHELCTGSGAIAISVAAERPDWDLSASDISSAALALARRNALAILGRELPFMESDLFSALEGADERFNLILANPPYVPSHETKLLLARGWSEPALALDGGEDGLDLYRRIIPEALLHLRPGGLLLMESDSGQVGMLGAMLRESGYVDVRSVPDLSGLARVTGGRKPWKT